MKDVCKNITTKKYQIKQSEIKEQGKYPVISQSANYIEGYCNEAEKLYTEKPVIVFGDHTRAVKYIDFEFVVGADGVKILKSSLYSKYFYYLTLYAVSQIENKGYARHYNQLANVQLLIAPEEEQRRISNKLDEFFDILDTISAEFLY